MSDGDGKKVLPPSLREGVEDVVTTNKGKRKENASTGAQAATMRALSARLFAFYFRAPIKSFFRARVESVNLRSNASYRELTKI